MLIPFLLLLLLINVDFKSKIAIDSHQILEETPLHYIFDVSIIVNHCSRHGVMDLKSKIGIDSHLILE